MWEQKRQVNYIVMEESKRDELWIEAVKQKRSREEVDKEVLGMYNRNDLDRRENVKRRDRICKTGEMSFRKVEKMI